MSSPAQRTSAYFHHNFLIRVPVCAAHSIRLGAWTRPTLSKLLSKHCVDRFFFLRNATRLDNPCLNVSTQRRASLRCELQYRKLWGCSGRDVKFAFSNVLDGTFQHTMELERPMILAGLVFHSSTLPFRWTPVGSRKSSLLLLQA